MDRAVQATHHIPHYVKTSPHERLTTIAVDNDVLTADGRKVCLSLSVLSNNKFRHSKCQNRTTHLSLCLPLSPLIIFLIAARRHPMNG